MKIPTTKYLIKGDIFSSCSNLFFFTNFHLTKCIMEKKKMKLKPPVPAAFQFSGLLGVVCY